MKKKIIIIVIILTIIIMLFPTRNILKDGGTIEYKSFLYKVTKYHRLINESNTFTGWKVEILGLTIRDDLKEEVKEIKIDNPNNDELVWQANKQKMISCIENELGGYLATEKNELIDLPLTDITDKLNKIQYYKGLKTNTDKMYVLFDNTPSEYEVLKDFDLYFASKYSIYQRHFFNNGVTVLINSPNNDIDFKTVEKKCSFESFEVDKINHIPSKTINKLNDTTKIIIKSGSNNLGTIEDKNTIKDILEIISTSEQRSFKNIDTAYLCDGHAFDFVMYNDKNKLIDTIYVWHDGTRLIPKSIHRGCSYYSTNTDKDLRKIIEESTNHKYYSYTDYGEECSNNTKELIYEDNEYKYYLRCPKSDKLLIHFDITNQTMNIKYALNNNYITPNQLVLYNDLMLKEKK